MTEDEVASADMFGDFGVDCMVVNKDSEISETGSEFREPHICSGWRVVIFRG